MFDIVSIGGATQDLFFISSDYHVHDGKLQFTWGEKFVVEDLFVDVGGGACNSAVGFSRLGLLTALWCKVAPDPAGEFVLRRLKNEGVARDFIDLNEDGATSLSAIFLDETGERSIVMFRNGNDKLDPDEIDFEKLFDTRWIFVAELTGNPTPLITQIAERAQQENVKLAFVPGLDQLEQGVNALGEILARTEVLIFNAFEASKLLGRPVDDSASTNEIKKMLVELSGFGVKKVVITKDVDGVQAFDGKDFYEYPAPIIEKIVDTTGAGDAFSSGFIAALAKGQKVEEALELGTKNAGSVIQKLGAQTGLLKSVNVLMSQCVNGND